MAAGCDIRYFPLSSGGQALSYVKFGVTQRPEVPIPNSTQFLYTGVLGGLFEFLLNRRSQPILFEIFHLMDSDGLLMSATGTFR